MKRTVVCFGDSITNGLPGRSFLNYVSPRRYYRNKGFGGDTLRGMTRRLKWHLRRHPHDTARRYVVAIGTNDVILPFLRGYSIWWRAVIAFKGFFFGCIPCRSAEEFATRYEEMLRLFLDRGKSVLVIGIPLIEYEKYQLNEIVRAYNQIILSLCEKYGLPYIDFFALAKQLKGDNRGDRFLFKTHFVDIYDGFMTSLLPFSMQLSRRRGLAVTVDGVHSNAFLARALAGVVEEALAQTPPDAPPLESAAASEMEIPYS